VIVVDGVTSLAKEHGRLFFVLGVFDGLHRGHAYLLDQLRQAATEHRAQPAVITFDHHPDEVITGIAPPLLLDPAERLERLASAGVALTVVQHFDDATRRTPYDAFVRAIAERVELAGFLMTPDSSFGFERGGTTETVAALGRELGYEVVVVPTLDLDGAPVRSSVIRARIATGDLDGAADLLGHGYAVVGESTDRDGRGQATLQFGIPVALPPPGRYRASVNGRPAGVEVVPGGSLVVPEAAIESGPTRVAFGGRFD
jgi:riboflavin kinase/FMN adenylyltransferase